MLTDSSRLYRWRPRLQLVLGRRAVLSGALGVAVGTVLRPSVGTSLRDVAAGAQIYSYGHSYTIRPNPYVARRNHDEYPLQLGRRLGSGPVICRGRSGTRFVDSISAIIAPTFAGSTSRRWHLGDRGIVLLHNMMNDVSCHVGGNADYLNAYEKALRLALGVFGARSFSHADRATRVGPGWMVRGYARVEDGRTWCTSTHGDKISFAISGGDSVHVSSLCTDPLSLAQGTLSAECNGKVLGYFGRGPDDGTYTCNRALGYPSSVDRGTQNRWIPAGWRIAGLNAAAGTRGQKTLTLRKVDQSVAAVWVQGVYVTSPHAPPVLVAKEPPRNPSATVLAAVDAFYHNEPSYRALIDRVCNEYRYVYPVDLRPGWDNATMVSALDTSFHFHPNTLGMSCIADNFRRAVSTHITATTAGLR